MIKAERARWHRLAWELSKLCVASSLDYEVGICSLCRYGKDDCGEVACGHPSDTIRHKVEDAAVIRIDCWAFRPRKRTVGDAREEWRELIAEEVVMRNDAAGVGKEAPHG